MKVAHHRPRGTGPSMDAVRGSWIQGADMAFRVDNTVCGCGGAHVNMPHDMCALCCKVSIHRGLRS
jgi:hypothetical protein